MICKNCGQELPENINFCSACGSALHSEPESVPENTVAEESPVQTEPIASQSADTEFATPDFDDKKPEKKTGSKKKKIITRSLLIAIPLVVALLVFLNWNALAGFCVKTFGSDADYLRYVESKRVDTASESVSSFFSELDYNSEQGVTAKIKLNMSEELIDLLSEANVDNNTTDILRWLNDVTLVADAASQKDMSRFCLAAEVDGTTLLSGNMVADFDDGEFYLSLPELSNGIFAYEMPTSDAPFSTAELTAMLEDLHEALPSEDVFAELLKRYMNSVLDSLDNVSSYEKNVSINGIEEECTVLRVTFDEKTVLNIAKSVLEEAKNDKELKSCLNRLLKFIRKYNSDIPNIDLDSVYSEDIDTLLRELERSSSFAGNEEYFTWCDYVVDHEVIGGAIEFEGEEVFRYITLHDGDNFTFELYVTDGFEIQGKGKTENDILSATYTVSAMMPGNTELFYIDVSNFNLAKLKKGNLCGSFRLTPSDDLLDSADSSIKLLNPSLELVSEQSANNSELTLNVYTHDEILAGISFDCDLTENSDVTIPKGQTFDPEDSEDVLRWIETLDLDGLVKALKRTDAPEIIYDAIEDLQDAIDALNAPTEESTLPAISESPAENEPSTTTEPFILF